MSRIRLFITLAGSAFASVLVTTISAAPASQQRKPDPGPGPALIDCLDAQVQERFGKAVMEFGYARVADRRSLRHKFRPENTRELDAVGGLESAGLQVVLYVAGRQVLDPAFNPKLPPARAMQGPVRVTKSAETVGDAPLPVDLLPRAAEAFAAFAKGESYAFQSGAWHMIARPVRAKDGTCLECHYQRPADEVRLFGASDDPSRVHVGDPLGAIVYGYRRSS